MNNGTILGVRGVFSAGRYHGVVLPTAGAANPTGPSARVRG